MVLRMILQFKTLPFFKFLNLENLVAVNNLDCNCNFKIGFAHSRLKLELRFSYLWVPIAFSQKVHLLQLTPRAFDSFKKLCNENIKDIE